MDEKIYKITLADGTELSDLRLNGNNFVSAAPVTADIFDGNLESVVINDGERDEIHENMALVQVTEMGGEYWFILRDVSAEEFAQMKLRADLDFVALMSDIDLD